MKKFGRRTKHRINMIKNLAVSVLIYEKVTTTQAKAKESSRLVNKAITIAKKNTLNSRKELLSMFMHQEIVVKKLIDDLALRFKDVNSGYVKLYKYSPRVGDNAPRVIMILSISKFLKNLKPIESKKESEPKLKSDSKKDSKPKNAKKE